MSARRKPSRILVGLVAAASALGAAAMMSAVAAPAARADDITDIINAVEGDYADGQHELTLALTLFDTNQFAAGLSVFFAGVDDDSLSVINNVTVGTVEALTQEPISGSFPISLGIPADYAEALSEAQTIFSDGESLLNTAASFFAAGDYSSAASSELSALDFLFVYWWQEILIGAALSF